MLAGLPKIPGGGGGGGGFGKKSCAHSLSDPLNEALAWPTLPDPPSLDMSIQWKLPLRMELHLAETFWI